MASKIISFVAAVVFGFSGAWADSAPVIADKYYPRTPNPEMTPGHLCTRRDPDFTMVRYKEKIPYCQRNVSPNLKAQIYRQYKVPEAKWKNYTIDHFIPLAIGGSNHRSNLWPEHRKIKELRKDLEVIVYNQLRRGEITQKEAIEIITEAKMNPPSAFFDLADSF